MNLVSSSKPLPSVLVKVNAGNPLMAADLVAADIYATMHESGFSEVRIDMAQPSPGSFVWEIRYRDASGRRYKSEVDRPNGVPTIISRALLGLQHRLDDAHAALTSVQERAA